MNTEMRTPVCLLLVTLATIVPAPGRAHELVTTLGIGLEYSDNIRRAPEGEELEESLFVPSLALDYRFAFSRLDATLRYDASREDYRDDLFEDRSRVLGQGSLRWTLVENKLLWELYQTRTLLTVDAGRADTPDNQTDRDMKRTGPMLQLRFGTGSSLVLQAHHVETRFNKGGDLPGNTMRFYRLQYMSELSARTSAGLFAIRTESEYEGSLLEYNAERAGFEVEFTGRDSTTRLTLGGARLDRGSGEPVTGTLASLAWSRQGKRGALRIHANRELTDSGVGLGLSDNLTDPLQPGDTGFANTDVVERTRYEISSHSISATGRFAVGVDAHYDRHDLQTLPDDQTSFGVRTSFEYRPGPGSAVTYSYDWREHEFEGVPGTEEHRSRVRYRRLDWSYTPNRKSRFSLWIAHGEQDHWSPEGIYEEASAGMRMSYQL